MKNDILVGDVRYRVVSLAGTLSEERAFGIKAVTVVSESEKRKYFFGLLSKNVEVLSIRERYITLPSGVVVRYASKEAAQATARYLTEKLNGTYERK